MTFNRSRLLNALFVGGLIALSSFGKAEALTIGGPFRASSVTVTGAVAVSSMTVSTITAANYLGLPSRIGGSIAQMKFSSSAVTTTVSATTFTAVPDIAQAITLSNAGSYVRVSLTGNLLTVSDGQQPAYVSVFRDSTNLGDVDLGLGEVEDLASYAATQTEVPVGLQLIDHPGDTSSHTYRAYIRVSSSGQTVDFPHTGAGYLLLEEVSPFGSGGSTRTWNSSGINVSGPIIANNAIVDGDVSISSITVSSLTVSGSLSASYRQLNVLGVTQQVAVSSTTLAFTTTSSTYVAVPSLSVNIGLKSPSNYFRISVSGTLGNGILIGGPQYLSVMRDSTVLVAGGLATSQSKPSSVGVTFLDFPADTATHTYSVAIKESGGSTATFPISPVGYLLVEEINH